MAARKRIMTDRAACELAVKLIGDGKCLQQRLTRAGVSKTDVMRVIRRAEAEYVNGSMRLFARPSGESNVSRR